MWVGTGGPVSVYHVFHEVLLGDGGAYTISDGSQESRRNSASWFLYEMLGDHSTGP